MKALQDFGWECSVLLAKTHPGVQDYTVDGIAVKAPQGNAEVKRLPFEIFPDQDIILTQLSGAGRGGILARQFGKPSLHLVHNDHLHNEATSRKYTDFSIYNTSWIQDQWSLPGMVVHPVVNPQDYRVDSTKDGFITLVNLSEGSDCNYNKGWETFYELARRMPDRQFLGVKGAYGIQHIEKLPNVAFLDHQADIRVALSMTSLILQPSEYESYGRTAVEAFASGIPCISTPQKGVLEALGDAAEYADFRDFDQWENAVRRVTENYSECSARALSRSAEVHKRSQNEIEDFLTVCEILSTDGVGVAMDFLKIPWR